MSEHDNNDNNGLRVEVINLSYSLESNQQSLFPWEKHNNWKKKSIQLLSNISFIVEKGELCGLMGSSGAGKSTLLDMIANRKLSGSWSGEILMNGRRRGRWFNRDVSYVLQDDIHLPTLTVEETVTFSVNARMAEGTSSAARRERVDFLLEKMGLAEIRTAFVGDSFHKGISGGEMKRLSIA
eukprot:gene30458-40472_t